MQAKGTLDRNVSAAQRMYPGIKEGRELVLVLETRES